MSAPEKLTGKCKWFNAKKGFGFITRDDGEEDVFVHQTGIISDGFRSLAEDEEVEFSLTQDNQGRLKAVNVTGPSGVHVKGSPKPQQRRRRRRRGPRDENNNEGGEEAQNTNEEQNQPSGEEEQKSEPTPVAEN
jgi:cellular nucleic acid-binding protein